MSAVLALRAAEVAGVVVALGVDELVLEASSAPPALITEAVFRHRGEIAALLRYGGAGIGQPGRLDGERLGAEAKRAPAEWAEALARLSLMPRPDGFTAKQWDQILRDAEGFVEEWAEKAAQFGWTFADVFGVHVKAPAARYDGMGLSLLLRGGKLTALDSRRAVIRMSSGSELTFLRIPHMDSVPIWELATNLGEQAPTHD